MAEGRGSAKPVVVIGVALLVFMAVAQPTLARMYSVNWTFNVVGWPKGKTFRAGDVLVFNYRRGTHNVVPVSKGGYRTCTSRPGARVYQSGRDKFKLKRGNNFFICAYGGHCQGGMKLAIRAY